MRRIRQQVEALAKYKVGEMVWMPICYGKSPAAIQYKVVGVNWNCSGGFYYNLENEGSCGIARQSDIYRTERGAEKARKRAKK